METFKVEFTAVTAKGVKILYRNLSLEAGDKYEAMDIVVARMAKKHGVLSYSRFKFGAKKLRMTALTEHVLVTSERCDD